MNDFANYRLPPGWTVTLASGDESPERIYSVRGPGAYFDVKVDKLKPILFTVEDHFYYIWRRYIKFLQEQYGV